ncbi:unnamed protein product [Pieris brassicae]|uniref:Integrase catalytic domain-containing protein n=1 Tax=Pieris brassicae TaxID=7116 RepID=A0A9P0TQT9_PIEBR|nr:unnamed protein product [Pieris brassicae]
MDKLYQDQLRVWGDIQKLTNNYKKDGADRKRNPDYFQSRLLHLEELWNKFQCNHDRMLIEYSQDHKYFQEMEYEQSQGSYHSIKETLSQAYQDILLRMEKPKASTSVSEFEEQGTSERQESAQQQQGFGINTIKQKGLQYQNSKGRGIKCTKGYIAVFICMATKAVHLEVVSDLTTSAFLAALKRMAARRGTPEHIYSDNGTNFIGANRVLDSGYDELKRVFAEEQFATTITDMEINWHFNAPAWPSAGGLWEAAVKSLKAHTKKVIGDQKFTYEELSTLVAQLETCLNTRPLCPISEDPEDINFLTPAHFLTGGPTLSLLPTENDLRTRWYLVEKTFQDIWKRWQSEYLPTLTSRSKWQKPRENLKLQDLVAIHDANIPPGKWAMGRVVELHPGTDNIVRVVSLNL